MSTCPPVAQLEALLTAQLGDVEVATLSRHLEVCDSCRQKLDQLSSDADSGKWRRLRDPERQAGGRLRAEFVRRLEQAVKPPSAPSLLRVALDQPSDPEAPLLTFPPPEGYELLAIAGRGGMGVVYKARNLKLNRIVALKMLLADKQGHAEDLARFRAEAETIARLQHPNIVQIYEIGEQHGRPFLALEFVNGPSLAEELRGIPLAPRAAAEILETLAGAVHHAHQHGVVHRDLKPANILLQRAESGEPRAQSQLTRPESALALHSPLSALCPKITDFGLAKRLGEAGPTQTGQVLGTPSYMAPEQARAQSKAISPATDIYALGAILYQLLTGRPPFQGVSAVDTVMQVLHQEPVPPRRLQPRLPLDLNTICLKCLEKEPRRRYATAQELADELVRFREGVPIRTRRVGLLEQGWRWCRRNRALAGALVSLLLVLVGAILGVTWAYVEAEHAHAREALQRKRAEAHLYYSRIALAEREWLGNNVARAEELLEQCRPAEGQPDRRAWEWYYLKRLCHADLGTLTGHHFPVYGLAYSPDGKYLVSAAGDPAYTNNPRTTPGELTLWDAEQHRKLGEFNGHTGRVNSVTFHRDGLQLASLSSDQTVRLWEVATRRLVTTFPCGADHYWTGSSAVFAPDGLTLALPQYRDVKLVELATGAVLATFAGHTGQVGRIAFSPDGTLLAAGSSGTLRVWDLATRRERYRVSGSPITVTFAPDGTLLASGQESTVQVWAATSGQAVTALRGHEGRVQALAWSPDARLLASGGADQTVRVWDLRTGQERGVFRGHTRPIVSLAYHPDGRRVASGDEGGVIKVWDVGKDQRAQVLTPAAHSSAVAFTADGRGVVALLSGGSKPHLRGWDLGTGQETLSRAVSLALRREWPIQYVTLSTDGRWCAGPAMEDQSVLRVVEVATGVEVAALRGHQASIRTVAFSPDGRRLVSASGGSSQQAPPELFIWQVPTADQPPVLPLPLATPAGVQCLAFSADGQWLATGDLGVLQPEGKVWKDGGLSIWDVATGRLLRRWVGQSGAVQAVTFDPSGRRLASGGRSPDKTVKVWEADTGRQLHDLQGPAPLTGLTFSPDGRRLAAVGYDGWVRLWDPETGQDILTLRGTSRHRPEGVVADSQVVFSPDGTQLAVNSWAEAIHIWDGRPGR